MGKYTNNYKRTNIFPLSFFLIPLVFPCYLIFFLITFLITFLSFSLLQSFVSPLLLFRPLYPLSISFVSPLLFFHSSLLFLCSLFAYSPHTPYLNHLFPLDTPQSNYNTIQLNRKFFLFSSLSFFFQCLILLFVYFWIGRFFSVISMLQKRDHKKYINKSNIDSGQTKKTQKD